jgi:hypothetical protein
MIHASSALSGCFRYRRSNSAWLPAAIFAVGWQTCNWMAWMADLEQTEHPFSASDSAQIRPPCFRMMFVSRSRRRVLPCRAPHCARTN